MLILALSVGGFADYQFLSVSNRLPTLVGEYSELKGQSQELINDLLTARRYEKDFWARKDAAYVKSMQTVVMGMIERAERMAGLVKKIGRHELADNPRQIKHGIQDYHQAFGRVTGLVSARGDKSSGIQGRARDESHKLEGFWPRPGATP